MNSSPPYHNSTKRSRLTTNDASILQPLSEKEMLENSSYIINTYVEMTNDELQTWQQSVINKCLHENKVNFLLDQLKNMDPTDFNYPATRYFHSNSVMGRTRSLSFEDCAISMAIDNCGLQQTSSQSHIQQHWPQSSDSNCGSQQTTSVSETIVDTFQRNDGGPDRMVATAAAPGPINHSNFMETAVQVAIQEKGLSPSNIQVSPNR